MDSDGIVAGEAGIAIVGVILSATDGTIKSTDRNEGMAVDTDPVACRVSGSLIGRNEAKDFPRLMKLVVWKCHESLDKM